MTFSPIGSDVPLRRVRAFALALALATSTLAGASVARAQDAEDNGPSPADKAAAETLFKEGRALLKAKKHAEAARKFEESMRLDPQPGTQVNLALAYERLGKHASAWINYTEVATKAERAGQDKRAQVARKRAALLEPKLPKLTIEVDASIPDMVIERGSTAVGDAQWGVAVPVDPGTIIIRARAEGYETWTKEITIPDAPEVTTVQVPALEKLPEPPAPEPDPDPKPVPVPFAEPRLVPVVEEDPGAGQRVAGYVVGGFGLASLAVGAVMGGLAIERKGASLDFCPNDDNQCFDEGVSIRQDALTYAHVSTATLVVGGALSVAGLVVLLTAPDGETKEEGVEARLSPMLAPTAGGMWLEGRF